MAAAALLGDTVETWYVPNTGLVVRAARWRLGESWDTAEPVRGDVTAGGAPLSRGAEFACTNADSHSRTQDSRARTQDSRARTQDSGRASPAFGTDLHYGT